MMRSIVQACLKSRLVVVAVTVSLLAFGLYRIRQMPVDVLPEFSPPYVEIQTESLGLSAEEVEQLITVPMEQDLLNGVPWLTTIRSESVPGLSSIVLVFERGTDLMRARQMVSERMTQAVALPHVSSPPMMLQPLSATSRVMIVGLSSKSLTPIQMSVLARWTIAPRLMGVPGVANVSIWGQRDRQLQVQVDPQRLKDKGVSLFKVLETTGNALWVSSLSFVEASTPGTGGFIDTDNQRLGIRHILPIVSSEGLSQVPIDGTSYRLGDVASVVENHQPLIGDALTKDGAGLMLVIEKFPGANTLDVTRGVEEAFSELHPGLPGMDIDPSVFRPAAFIEAALRDVGLAILIGLALLALILAAFFFAWRTTLIALVAIPLSLIAAVTVLALTGGTMNMIALTGLVVATGAVTWFAIIDVENIVQRVRQRRGEGGGPSTARIILEASNESRGIMVYAAPILLLIILPIFFIEGPSGTFYRPMAITYVLAVLASFLVALTVTPTLAVLLLLRARVERSESPAVVWLQRFYEAALAPVIRRAGFAYMSLAVLAAAGLAMMPLLNQSTLPAYKERSLLIDLRCVPGTSQPEMSRITGRVGDELRSLPGVHNVGVHIGRAVRGDQVVNVNAAEMWINIDRSADYDRTAAAIQRVVDSYPGLHHEVRSYLRTRSSDVVPEPDDNVVVRVYGDVDKVLRAQAEQVRQAIAGIKGIAHSKIESPVLQATVETEVDLDAARKHGLKPGDVRRAAATLLSGIVVGSLFEEQKVFDVVVWSTPETRRSLSSIRDLLIDTPGGGHARLGDVAKVNIVPRAGMIRHEAVKRYVDVFLDVEGRSRGAVVADIQSRLRQVPLALEYRARVMGDHEPPRVVQSSLLVFGLVTAIGVLFLLQAAFGSWRLALLGFASLPAAALGGLVVAAVAGTTTSFGSLAGVLAVLGIAACNTLVLMHRYQHLERVEGEVLGPQLALRGARERFAPMAMTMLATGASLLPALLLGDVPGLEIARPIAAVVLGGLVSSGLVQFFLLPAAFLNLAVSSVRVLDPFALSDAPQVPVLGGLAEAPAATAD